MIKGMGIDIIEVSRIDRAYKKNKRFLEKVFSKREIAYIKSRNFSSLTIAGLFSSKESVSKALGTGIRGFKWIDIEITHDNLGRPRVGLKNNAKNIARQKNIDNITLSISHIKDQAISISIAEGSEVKEKCMNFNELKNILVSREKISHKGTYGKIGIIGGSKGMSGAPFLASSSALRTGSGLVYTMVPEVISNIIEIKTIEAIVKSFKGSDEGFSKASVKDIISFSNNLDVVALGPGLGLDKDRIELVGYLLKSLNCPIVLDADGINAISKNKEILKHTKEKIVLTPHPMEFSRLIDMDIEKIQDNREKYTKEFAEKYNLILVLKGHKTVVSDGKSVYINSTGNPGMATAGSGDVLTGIITSLIGQGVESFNAAKLGVYLHGLAADIVKEKIGEHGLIASDIINTIPYAIEKTI